MSDPVPPDRPLTDRTVAIVGASLAGLRAAETLRQLEFPGRVVMVSGESHRPYDRPPLSKRLLAGEWEPDRIHLRRPEAFDELDVEWRFGVRATGLDLAERTIVTDDGESLDVDGVIVATGATPRRLPDQPDHVFELRTLDDALALRAALAPGGRRVVVIGAGFIGLEVAATARQRGNEVTVLEGLSAPLVRGLGSEMGTAIQALHDAEGVSVRCGVTVAGIATDGVRLADDELVAADVIVVGIGVTPVTGWLDGSGLQLRDGVVCDAALRALGADGTPVDGIYAAGDLARWPNELFGEEMRVEHWTNAAEQGAHAASNLVAEWSGAETAPYAPVPFFWSDQYAHRIQFLGRSASDDRVEVVAGSIEDATFLALYERNGRLHGALGVNAPRLVMKMRPALLAQLSWDDALAHAATL